MFNINILKKSFCDKINYNFINLCKVYRQIEINRSYKTKETLLYDYLKGLNNSRQIENVVNITIRNNKDENVKKKMDIDIPLFYERIIIEVIKLNRHLFPTLNIDLDNVVSIENVLENFSRNVNVDSYKLLLSDVRYYKEEFFKFNQNINNKRLNIVSNLLNKCYDDLEALYIFKIFSNKLNIGVGSIIINRNITNLHKEGIFSLRAIQGKQTPISLLVKSKQLSVIQPGTPIIPMLCHFPDSLDSIFGKSKQSELLIESKYNGERTQVNLYLIRYILMVKN
jgi:hypothetical protein